MYAIYLLECTLCDNKPYVGKCENKENQRINTHRTDSKRPNSIAVDKYFAQPNHEIYKTCNIHVHRTSFKTRPAKI